jgi:Flp pilus assembly protein TadD
MALVKVDLRDIHKRTMEGVLAGNEAEISECILRTEQFLERDPHNWFALFILGIAYRGLGKSSLAQAIFYRAGELWPDEVAIWNNIGTCFRENHNVELASKTFEDAIKKWPNDGDLLINLGTMHINEGSPARGEEVLRRAIEANPMRAEAHWNLGLTLLEQEKWEEGFREYAWGQVGGNRMVKNYGSGVNSATWWNGEAFDGTLIVYGEQGVGDEVMYASMLPELSRMCSRLIFDAHPRLCELFKESFDDLFQVEVFPTRKDFDTSEEWWTSTLDWSRPVYKIPFGNVPKYLRKREEDFPKKPYLYPNGPLVEIYKERFRKVCEGRPPIGISWIGGAKSTRKDLRSIWLREMYDAVKNFGKVLSVQYTGSQEYFEKDMDITDFPDIFESVRWERHYPLAKPGMKMRELSGEHVKVDEEGFCYLTDKVQAKRISPCGQLEFTPPPLGFDLRQTCAAFWAIHELGGAIVTVNNSNVHLCGALGIPTFVLTPSAPAWRYGLERTDVIWYPKDSVRQYRQKPGETWAPALAAMTEDLSKYLVERNQA